MQTQLFLPSASQLPRTLSLELPLQLHVYPKPDREPVKILVIGSKEAVGTIVHSLHYHRFAEISEWTNFLHAPSAKHPLQSQPDEVMKVLVKYIAKQK